MRDSAIDILLNADVIRTAQNGVTTFSGIPDSFNVTIEHVRGIVAAGGDVHEWPCYLLIQQDDYADILVPPFFAGAFGQNNETQESYLRTWQEWIESATNGVFVPTPTPDGLHYLLSGNAHGNMPGSVLAQITNECTLLNQSQAQELMSSV